MKACRTLFAAVVAGVAMAEEINLTEAIYNDGVAAGAALYSASFSPDTSYGKAERVFDQIVSGSGATDDRVYWAPDGKKIIIGDPLYVLYEVSDKFSEGADLKITGYSVVAHTALASVDARLPLRWRLEGSNDHGESWFAIGDWVETTADEWKANFKVQVDAKNVHYDRTCAVPPTTCRKFRFRFDSAKTVNNDGKIMLSELRLWGEIQSVKTCLFSVEDVNVVDYGSGRAYSINVVPLAPTEGATIKYAAAEEGPYESVVAPSFSEVGEHIVWFEVSAEGYESARGSAKVTIAPFPYGEELDLTELARELNAPEAPTYQAAHEMAYGPTQDPYMLYNGTMLNDISDRDFLSGITDKTPGREIYQFTEAFRPGDRVILRGYEFVHYSGVGNQKTERLPVSWTLEGSNDGDVWTTLVTREKVLTDAELPDYAFDEATHLYTYHDDLANDISYRFYRFTFPPVKVTGGTRAQVQLSEIRLLGTVEKPLAPQGTVILLQ